MKRKGHKKRIRPFASSILLLASLFSFGCGAKPPSPPAPPRISDSYAKAALKALDTIYLIRRGAPEALVSADAEAVSADETALTKKLYSMYEQERNNDSIRRLLAAINEGKSQEYMYDPNIRRERQRGRHNLEAKILEADSRELACYKIFADALRNRSAAAPKECGSVEVQANPACYKIFADAHSAPAPKECDSLSIEN